MPVCGDRVPLSVSGFTAITAALDAFDCYRNYQNMIQKYVVFLFSSVILLSQEMADCPMLLRTLKGLMLLFISVVLSFRGSVKLCKLDC